MVDDSDCMPSRSRVFFVCPFTDWQVDMTWGWYTLHKDNELQDILREHLAFECKDMLP
jgi:hypothetical protein